nr:1-deoxy-D-xylulose-5-phosphate reductoisomerase [Collinsella sp. zg1085]
MVSDCIKTVAILGASGSVGTQTIDVIAQHTDKLALKFISVHTQTKTLVDVAQRLSVPTVAVTDERHSHDAVLSELSSTTKLLVGMHDAIEACKDSDIDIVVLSVVGAAGLTACYELIKAGKTVALANKESLVVGGDLIMPMVAADQLLPVDSEHAAIFQCYQGEDARATHKIWLTCSGGPFRGLSRQELMHKTPSDALAHPTWNMGAKISIDSATLMNKGLERIEAMHLFHADLNQIEILIHPESKIHSMVEYCDGSILAHIGISDMRIPIQYALSYPERWETPAPRLNFFELQACSFDAPDMESFRCLQLAERAARARGTMPCVLNAANEIAVYAFLDGSIGFTAIDETVERCMDMHVARPVESLEHLLEVDAWSRSYARQVIRRYSS